MTQWARKGKKKKKENRAASHKTPHHKNQDSRAASTPYNSRPKNKKEQQHTRGDVVMQRQFLHTILFHEHVSFACP